MRPQLTFLSILSLTNKTINCKIPLTGIINRKIKVQFSSALFRHLISYLRKIVMKIHHFDKVVINKVNGKTDNEFWVSFQEQDCTINCMTIVISILGLSSFILIIQTNCKNGIMLKQIKLKVMKSKIYPHCPSFFCSSN